MFLLLFVLVVIIAYLKAFKDDFTQENVSKVAMAAYVVLGFIVFIQLLKGFVGH